MSGAPKAACRQVPFPAHPGVQAAFLVSATFSGRTLLGRHSRPSRTRVIARRIPVAAAPAIVGAALAAGCGAPAGQVAAQGPVHQTAAEAATAPSRPAVAELVSLSRPAIVTSSGARAAATQTVAARAAAPARYTVKAGDTLSSIAKRVYHDPRYWPVLYRANHKTLRYANEITEGQVLTVPAKPAKIPAAPSAPGPAQVQSSGSATTALATTAPIKAASTTVSTTGDSSFQACVIARESGGNSQVMNASGHYGLYQFSASTWAAYGGNPADFGHASVAEQNQVFNNAIAAGGQSNWSAYDGC
jgi:LysM repeat protein